MRNLPGGAAIARKTGTSIIVEFNRGILCFSHEEAAFAVHSTQNALLEDHIGHLIRRMRQDAPTSSSVPTAPKASILSWMNNAGLRTIATHPSTTHLTHRCLLMHLSLYL